MPHRTVRSAALLSALLALLTATFVVAPARADTAACITVQVDKLVADQGFLMVSAYADAASYNKAPAAALQMKVTGASMTFPLCGVGGSRVAVRAFQDLNSNGKLDVNLLGIPSEPWGASGKPPAMSAPTWETTQVPIDGTPIVVRMST